MPLQAAHCQVIDGIKAASTSSINKSSMLQLDVLLDIWDASRSMFHIADASLMASKISCVRGINASNMYQACS